MVTALTAPRSSAPRTPAPLELIAMHGWAGEASQWAPWLEAVEPLGWGWQSGERGYGNAAAAMPGWGDGGGRRVLLGHSIGPHLVPSALLASADAVVLLASFGRFLPPGREGRGIQAALAAMAANLHDAQSARAMLQRFLAKAAEPLTLEQMPPGPAQGPLSPTNRRRLRDDLELLARCSGLPRGFPAQGPVLIVEAQEDRIIGPEVRALLRAELPAADVVTLPATGHALLRSPLIPKVLEWLQASVAP
ncbi:MAG: alpha/beta hydrolase [Prochlorococcaceae cyanobacterium]